MARGEKEHWRKNEKLLILVINTREDLREYFHSKLSENRLLFFSDNLESNDRIYGIKLKLELVNSKSLCFEDKKKRESTTRKFQS